MIDELTGTFTLVHPGLQPYPVANQGMIGLISANDLNQDQFYVTFSMGEQARYTSGALMVLKRPSVIYADMMRNVKKLETADFSILFRLCMLLDSGLTRDKIAAIQLARDNETVRNFSMESLSKLCGVKQVKQLQTVSC